MTATREQKALYVIDTSSLVAINELSDANEETWKLVIEQIEKNKLKSPVQIMDELERVDEDAFKRVKLHANGLLYRDTPELILEAGRITRLYPNMSRARSKHNVADPYIVALAKILGCSVITNEGKGRQKMHRVCAKEGISSLTLSEFMSKVRPMR